MYHESRQTDEGLAKRGIKRLDIDPATITWNRVVDVCDRTLRQIQVGFNDDDLADGSPSPIFPRQTGFDITVASELMAILALTTGLKDLRAAGGPRGGRHAASRANRSPLEDLGVAGAVTVLLKDAIMPNLMQTLEGQPAFVHAGPFANIAHGNSSILADQIALRLGDYVVTESGFGADIGMEKFFDIKCRYSGLIPNAVVLVATIRALKMHGGGPKGHAGRAAGQSVYQRKSWPARSGRRQPGAPYRDCAQVWRAGGGGDQPFLRPIPTPKLRWCERIAQRSRRRSGGDVRSLGAMAARARVELAEAVVAACEKPSHFKFLYPLELPIKQKIETIAKEIYGADGVSFEPLAEQQIELTKRRALATCRSAWPKPT